jgi:hypothetical protein
VIDEFMAAQVAWLRARAEDRERYCEATAGIWARLADELERAYADWLNEPVTLAQAAELSGYTVTSLWRWVRNGVIPRVGKHGNALLVRLGDVPRKPRFGVQRLRQKGTKARVSGPDLAAIALRGGRARNTNGHGRE